MIIFPGFIGAIIKKFKLNWNLSQRLPAPSKHIEQFVSYEAFGQSVAVDSTGNRIIVGAPQDERSGSNVLSQGVVHIYNNINNVYVYESTLSGTFATGSNDYFGNCVAINSAGNRVIVGAIYDETGSNGLPDATGLGYVFSSGSSGWSQERVLSGTFATGSDDHFGHSVAINSAGNRVIVGAISDETGSNGTPDRMGLAYIFSSGSSGWSQERVLSGTLAVDTNDNFGYSVAMNSSGERVVVGAPNDERTGGVSSEGISYIYTSGSSGWVQEKILSGTYANDSNSRFGVSVAINSIGDRIIVGAERDQGTSFTDRGSSYVFISGTNGWYVDAFITGNNNFNVTLFGCSVAMNSVGDRVAIGARDEGVWNSSTTEGAVYIFSSGSSGWILETRTSGNLPGGAAPLSNEDFGISVGMNSSGEIVAIGAPGENFDYPENQTTASAGLVYVFKGR